MIENLSEAIRLGAMQHRQARGTYYDHVDHRTCALGAALDAIGQLDAIGFDALQQLQAAFPILRDTVTLPVIAPDPRIARYDLASAIIALNDQCLWTREAIADWVETLEQAKRTTAAPAVERAAVGA